MKFNQRTTHLRNLGTEVLIRPDDENSPEFKEYLRQLMRLQANRAQMGYAAPSSASSDVYIAKLNRIKLERMKMRELGLPEDAVDTSYKEEDYTAARSKHHPISDPMLHPFELMYKILSGMKGWNRRYPLARGWSDLLSRRSVSCRVGAKQRAITQDEVMSNRAAEISVQKYLEQHQELSGTVGSGQHDTMRVAVQSSSHLLPLRILRFLRIMARRVNRPKSTRDQRRSPVTAAVVAAPAPVAPVPAAPVPQQRHYPELPHPPAPAHLPSVGHQAPSPSAAASAVAASATVPPLNAAQTDVTKQALEWLVKHSIASSANSARISSGAGETHTPSESASVVREETAASHEPKSVLPDLNVVKKK
ncbi:unnamed protein product, partial [Sphagnum compactum]